jgi:hypothetical protein
MRRKIKNMKSNSKTIAALLLAGVGCLLSQGTYAIPITGDVTIQGIPGSSGVTATTSSGTTTITPTGTWEIDAPGDTGNYASVPGGTSVTVNPFSYTGTDTLKNPPVGVWSFTSGGKTFSFSLLTLTGATTSPVDITGTGKAYETGYDATYGVWTINSIDGIFNFETTVVPDGGMTIALLGFALVGVEGVRRKMSA